MMGKIDGKWCYGAKLSNQEKILYCLCVWGGGVLFGCCCCGLVVVGGCFGFVWFFFLFTFLPILPHLFLEEYFCM